MTIYVWILEYVNIMYTTIPYSMRIELYIHGNILYNNVLNDIYIYIFFHIELYSYLQEKMILYYDQVILGLYIPE